MGMPTSRSRSKSAPAIPSGLSPASLGADDHHRGATGAAYTVAGGSGATIQLGDDQQWSVDGVLNVSAVIWDNGESPSPVSSKPVPAH